MLIVVQDGRPVLLLVCPTCSHSVLVRLSERAKKCARCGERVEVPDGEKTQPA